MGESSRETGDIFQWKLGICSGENEAILPTEPKTAKPPAKAGGSIG